MIHGDATAAALEAVLDELAAAEDRAALAGHALAELEERLEDGDGPGLAAALTAAEGRLVAAAARLAELREKRRDLEARLGEREAFRVHARQCG
jgi:chromosome segregation ATPase